MVRVISSNALSSMVITVLLDSAQNVHIAGYSNTESTYNNSTQDLLLGDVKILGVYQCMLVARSL